MQTIESLYVLWKTTGDIKWRERGYEVFEAIERHARTPYGYANVDKVDVVPPPLGDDMPRSVDHGQALMITMLIQSPCSFLSYFLAETLKYLYLLFDESVPDPYPFEKWVFNTEAHPLPVFAWNKWEKERYGAE